jgi:Family of unknown function (DUF6289)
MKLTKTLRTFGIVATLLGTVATKSFALPANEVEIEYFSDATLTHDVGYEFRSCNGGVGRQGQRTRYRAVESTPCRHAGPSEVHCLVTDTLGTRETVCPANICNSGLFDCP